MHINLKKAEKQIYRFDDVMTQRKSNFFLFKSFSLFSLVFLFFGDNAWWLSITNTGIPYGHRLLHLFFVADFTVRWSGFMHDGL